MLDEAGRSLRPAKLWNNTQSPLTQAPAEACRRRNGRGAPGRCPPRVDSIETRLDRAQPPGLVAKARRIMLPFDYNVFPASGGHAVTERGGSPAPAISIPSTMAGTSTPSLAVPGVDWEGKLPEIVPSNARAELSATRPNDQDGIRY